MNDRVTYPQMALSLLRPTQITAGLRYVRSKALITARNRTRLAEFMMEHPVKVAIGPDNEPYVLDHHHWALAWQLAGHTTAPVRIVADYSGMTGEEFWSTLVARRLVHPFGVDGTRQPVSALPPGLRELKDDPYQSIAAFARRAGAYRKTGKAESTFVWADFFRDQVPLDDDGDEAFMLALVSAVKSARSSRARKLPGYIN